MSDRNCSYNISLFYQKYFVTFISSLHFKKGINYDLILIYRLIIGQKVDKENIQLFHSLHFDLLNFLKLI